MLNQVTIEISDELYQQMNTRMKDSSYSSANDNINELIRNDLQEYEILEKIENGLDDIKNNRFSSKSIFDIKNEVLQKNG